ncbi:MAG: flagellar basal-body rod protein FlgB [Halioglobus sp.]
MEGSVSVDVIDRVFGVSPSVLSIRSQRMALMSANLANADTPGYKAVDIDFGQALTKAVGAANGLRAENTRYINAGGGNAEIKYRTPLQTSLDGNTVETDREHAQFMDNAIRYQASLNFLERRVKGMMLALRGE